MIVCGCLDVVVASVVGGCGALPRVERQWLCSSARHRSVLFFIIVFWVGLRGGCRASWRSRFVFAWLGVSICSGGGVCCRSRARHLKGWCWPSIDGLIVSGARVDRNLLLSMWH